MHDQERGVRMAKVWCLGEKFHADEVEVERLRQWAVSLDRATAHAVARRVFA